jgi:YegS/Rv2252/BmrU family lipid kinase
MNDASARRKKVIVILNGISLEKKVFYHDYLPLLSKISDVTVFETLSKNDAVMLASKAADKYVDLIIAAGGDGTLNQVVNGVLRGREKETKLPVIGLISIGSGNDFARTAGLKTGAETLKNLILKFAPRKIDVGRISFTPFSQEDIEEKITERYFVNVADIGMGPMVVDKVSKSTRSFGHAFAYYKSIVSTFMTYKPMVVKAFTNDWTWEGKLRTLAIANGKYFGHGMCIAPGALPDDGMFSVFICGDVSVLDFIRYSSRLKQGKHIHHREVSYKETTSIELTSETNCMLEGDGEIFGTLPAKITLLDRQLNFLI